MGSSSLVFADVSDESFYASNVKKSLHRAGSFGRCLGILSIFAIAALPAQGATTIKNLGNLGSGSSAGNAVNDSGQVTGYARLLKAQGGSTYHAFLYSSDQMTDLGTLGGDVSEGYAINSSAQVVGWSSSASLPYRAAFYNNGQVSDLGTLGGTISYAAGINDSGQIVGWSYLNGDAQVRAFFYSNGQMTDIGALSGSSSVTFAKAINNSGQITGGSHIPNAGYWAFRYTNGQMINLGGLGGTSSEGSAINDSGQVVGRARTVNNVDHAFLYSNSQMLDLGALDATYSEAYGINNAGQVVGRVYNDGLVNERAFLYNKGIMIDLNSLLPANSGWVLQQANDINNAGQITGRGQYNGVQRAFLMTLNKAPVAGDDAPTVAEDSEATVFAVLANDTDGDQEPFAIISATAGSQGGLIAPVDANNDGHYEAVSYTPASNFNGTDIFEYTISDGHGGTDTGQVTVTVTPVNDVPVANAGSDITTTINDISVPVTLNGSSSSDIDGDTLSYIWKLNGTQIATGASPSVNLPVGEHTIVLTVSDGKGGFAEDSVLVKIILSSSTANHKANGNGKLVSTTKFAPQFNFQVSNDKKGLKGNLSYQDSPGGKTIRSTQILSLVIEGKTATITGKALVNGTTSVNFIAVATDVSAKGTGSDTFSLRLSDSWNTSGVLTAGNVTVSAPKR